MNHGIIKESSVQNIFNEINDRLFCEQCQNERSNFSIYDKKFNNSYSNLLPGFSSDILSIPIDVLIVAEAHGGGLEDTFRVQKDLNSEITGLYNYYLKSQLHKFHQKEIRKLLNELNRNKISWVFTDLIKCFVWQGNDGFLKGSENKSKAIQYCSKYLNNQIEKLLPKKVLSLGKTVTSEYFKLPKNIKHGTVHKIKIIEHEFEIVYSIFPSRNTADLWVENLEWENIIPFLLCANIT